MVFPSSLNFFSFLQYSPHGASSASRYSQELMRAVKYDGTIRTQSGKVRAIGYSALKLAEERDRHESMAKCFAGPTILVPMPRRAPLQSGWLWPAIRVCEALLQRGIGTEIMPLLRRAKVIRKSATAGKGHRPEPDEHFETLEVVGNRPLLSAAQRLVVVDDFITRGSTSLAAYARLREAFLDAQIDNFALIRTISPGEVSTIVAPVQGVISYRNGRLHREP